MREKLMLENQNLIYKVLNDLVVCNKLKEDRHLICSLYEINKKSVIAKHLNIIQGCAAKT